MPQIKEYLKNDPTKKSTSTRMIFHLASGRVSVNCVDWSPHMESKLNWVDHLRVTIETKEFRNGLTKKRTNKQGVLLQGDLNRFMIKKLFSDHGFGYSI